MKDEPPAPVEEPALAAELEPEPEPQAEPAAAEPTPGAAAPSLVGSATAEFDKKGAVAALRDALTEARACRRTPEPPGTAEAMVRFDPSGVVDYVRVVDSTYQATSTALCVEDTLKGKPAPRFGGDARAIRVKVDLF
jgi:hypothetical protein